MQRLAQGNCCESQEHFILLGMNWVIVHEQGTEVESEGQNKEKLKQGAPRVLRRSSLSHHGVRGRFGAARGEFSSSSFFDPFIC